MSQLRDHTAYDGKGVDYATARPPYADAAFTTLFDVARLPMSAVAADIGSGTGNVTRHLFKRVAKVLAVEPNDSMREQAEILLGANPKFTSIAATAEDTGLPDQCVDLIAVGQAIHWFDLRKSHHEFARLLRPEGWLAIIWNKFEPTPDPSIDGLFRLPTCKRFSFPCEILEPWSQYIAGARSASGSPNVGTEGYHTFEEAVRRTFAAKAINGTIAVSYTTELLVGKLNGKG